MKNNTTTQIRIPEFQSSPSRRFRRENTIDDNITQPSVPNPKEKTTYDKEEQCQLRLEKQRERSRSNRAKETEEQRQIRLEKNRERNRSNRTKEPEEQRQARLEKKREQIKSTRTKETEEQRQIRLEKQRERSKSNRITETEEQRQIRLEKNREQIRSDQINETEKQRQIRLEKKREQIRFNRSNETEEDKQIRLEQQKKRSQTNRTKKRLEKQKHTTVDIEQEDVEIQFSIRPPWPEPIPCDLKETRLQEFLQQMSMSVLAEVTCAVCNIRIPAKDSKKIPFSKIPNINLLKVGEELDHLLKFSNKDVGITITDNRITMAEPITSNI